MTIFALIMAGGHGTRMRASGQPTPKPMVPIAGTSLLERNVYALIRHGVTDIAVAVPGDIPSLVTFAKTRAAGLIRAAGARADILIEDRPLGNIGCAGRWRDRTDALLVVYADNLTTLDVAAVLRAHAASGADLTLATHIHPFPMPFGEVRVERGFIRAYVEKPTYHVPVCSAVSVLGTAALAALPDDRPTGLSQLAQSLIAAGGAVREFRHAAPWIDVNDHAAAARAEALVAAHQPEFDLWAPSPASSVTVRLAMRGGSARLTAPTGTPPLRSLPACRTAASAWVSFDDLDATGGRICRVHVVREDASVPDRDDGDGDGDGATWQDLSDTTALDAIARRAVALATLQATP